MLGYSAPLCVYIPQPSLRKIKFGFFTVSYNSNFQLGEVQSFIGAQHCCALTRVPHSLATHYNYNPLPIKINGAQ